MSKLLINESPLQVLPTLATKVGLNEAIFLQQLHYWLTPSAKYKPHYYELDGIRRPWIYNTYHKKEAEKETGWQANFPFWSVRTIKRIVSSLKGMGLIIVTDQFNSSPSNRTLWYTIDYDKLATLEDPTSGTLDSDNLSLSEGDNLALSRGGQIGTVMTETTTETTTEIKPPAKISTSNGNGSSMDNSNQVTAIIEAIRDNDAERKALNDLADQIANLCQVNIDLVSPKTRDNLKTVTLALYGKGITSQDLNSFRSWWYNEYWAGRKGHPPTPGQVGDTWGQFEAQRINAPAIKADDDGGFYV